ncbi:hypothetical protein [Actinomadura rugatobispora]|uniref:Uncharacterized protein n=1 Tax=Actinomadura rugatobispora TaxID=1994 RepID=A0ABW1A0V3_9ACTN|nr:hypothetical protein GCM10010200_106930 [Actinomadura rugatobispora]
MPPLSPTRSRRPVRAAVQVDAGPRPHAVTGGPDLREYALRCRPALARLHLLSCLQSSAPLPSGPVADGRAAVELIKTELDAALSALKTAGAAGTGAGGRRLLVARVTRLRLAADAMERVLGRAEEAGDLPGLRDLLVRFDILLSALGTVQHAVSDP